MINFTSKLQYFQELNFLLLKGTLSGYKQGLDKTNKNLRKNKNINSRSIWPYN